jgi:hypothetical protein
MQVLSQPLACRTSDVFAVSVLATSSARLHSGGCEHRAHWDRLDCLGKVEGRLGTAAPLPITPNQADTRRFMVS